MASLNSEKCYCLGKSIRFMDVGEINLNFKWTMKVTLGSSLRKTKIMGMVKRSEIIMLGCQGNKLE